MKVFVGIELGSTRIKAVAVDENGKPLASGGYDWENQYINGLWTYSLDNVWKGLQESYKNLAADYKEQQNKPMPELCGIGISAMMHGYLVLDKNDNQLAEFRTWRNTITEKSAEFLTKLFNFSIPQRWSIAHLHHVVTGREEHVSEIKHLTTLAGYVHFKLTGEKVVGVGEGSGMMPIDNAIKTYDKNMAQKFDEAIAEYDLPWRILDILPKVLYAGENAGALTAEGAKLLDPTGGLKPGVPFCPPEGDAGTGMVATNSIKPNTGNVSAGTSVFALLVLEKALSRLHPEIDVVTTPTGNPVTLVHCNNCTADLDAWVNLFGDVLAKLGDSSDKTKLYGTLYNAALSGDPDCGGLVSVNYLSGEHITGFHEGRPIFARTAESSFTVENFMRSLLFSSMASLRIGMNILTQDEGINVSKLLGHGGLFKTAVVGQKLMAGALNIPMAVMESAGEGGAWGIALLAAFSACKENGESLENFLDNKIFADSAVSVINPDPTDVKGFNDYLERYKKALKVEQAAVEVL